MMHIFEQKPEDIEKHIFDFHLTQNGIEVEGRPFSRLERVIEYGAFFFNSEQVYFNGGTFPTLGRVFEDFISTHDDKEITYGCGQILVTESLSHILAHNLLYMDMLGVANDIDVEKMNSISRSNNREPVIDRKHYLEVCQESGFYHPFYALVNILKDELEAYTKGVQDLKKRTITRGWNRYGIGQEDFGIEFQEGNFAIPLDSLPILKKKFEAIRDDITSFDQRRLFTGYLHEQFTEEEQDKVQKIKTTFRGA